MLSNELQPLNIKTTFEVDDGLFNETNAIPEGPDWVHHGNRRFSRRLWRPPASSWNSLWTFSTTWCCTVACLKERIQDVLSNRQISNVTVQVPDIYHIFNHWKSPVPRLKDIVQLISNYLKKNNFTFCIFVVLTSIHDEIGRDSRLGYSVIIIAHATVYSLSSFDGCKKIG